MTRPLLLIQTWFPVVTSKPSVSSAVCHVICAWSLYEALWTRGIVGMEPGLQTWGKLRGWGVQGQNCIQIVATQCDHCLSVGDPGNVGAQPGEPVSFLPVPEAPRVLALGKGRGPQRVLEA